MSSEPDPRTLAELSALADGTLDPRREAPLRELISASPELSELYERERQAVAALHTLRTDQAPARLRSASARARLRSAGRPARRRSALARGGLAPAGRAGLLYGGGLAVAIAAIVAALILVLPGGAPGSPSVSQAAALAQRGAVRPAPGPDRAQPQLRLAQDVQEVYFPNWSGRFGWRAVGQRTDGLGGRAAVTVYYARAGRQIAYTILASPALPWPGASTRWLGGIKLQAFRADGRLVVTWRRAGHTCVLSGTGASLKTLSRLAAWRMPGVSE